MINSAFNLYACVFTSATPHQQKLEEALGGIRFSRPFNSGLRVAAGYSNLECVNIRNGKEIRQVSFEAYTPACDSFDEARTRAGEGAIRAAAQKYADGYPLVLKVKTGKGDVFYAADKLAPADLTGRLVFDPRGQAPIGLRRLSDDDMRVLKLNSTMPVIGDKANLSLFAQNTQHMKF